MFKSTINSSRIITRAAIVRPYTTTSLRMAQNNPTGGTNASHAAGDSVVPKKAQEKVPQGLEESLPNEVHDTGAQTSNTGVGKTHAKDGGKASIVPEGIQKAVPESVERALPNAIHDTGDK